MNKKVFVALCVVMFLGISLTVILMSIEEPPLNDINSARNSITEAEKLKSSTFALGLIEQAHKEYEIAMTEWKIENERFILFRDYAIAKHHAQQAKIKAVQAIDKTNNYISDANKLIACPTKPCRMEGVGLQIQYLSSCHQ